MKKFLAFATLASVALVGCVNDEKMEMTSGAQKISFDTPVMSTQTRATNFGEIETTYPTTENFVVYAVKHTDAFTSTTWDAATDFMTGVVVKYNSTANGWGNETTDYYWPEDGDKLTFGAFSPTDVASVASYNNDGLTLSSFTVPATLGAQYDLMYSDLAVDKTQNETYGGYTGVPINFNHALSSIQFNIAKDSKLKETANLTGITVKSVADNGKFCQNLTQATPQAAWSDVTGSASYSVFSGSKEITSTSTLVHSDDMLLLPQTLENASVVTIAYTLNGIPYERNVKLNELKSGLEVINKWEMGVRYVYNISLDANVIYLAPKPDDWTSKVISIVL